MYHKSLEICSDMLHNPVIFNRLEVKQMFLIVSKKEMEMNSDMFDLGLKKRRETLGATYVNKNLSDADDFSRPFQEAMTAWCWGFGWGDETISPKIRSMMNLSMIGALGKMTEWEIHCRGALNNGVSKQEIRAIIHVVGIYCGVPQALECFRVAKKVLDEK